MIHCGSRGLGHQVASDYIKLMESEYGFENLPDRELINAPIKSELGQKYFSRHGLCCEFRFCNRQMIMHFVRESFKKIFSNSKLSLIYDVAHNIAKIEEHEIDGKK
jgi:tRNA-splicing ligase RtcB